MGVELDPGSAGAVVATDTIAGEEFSLIKLVDGAEDSAARIGGDATNGLDVDVTRLPALVAGTANIGDVDVASIAAGDNNIGNVDIVTLPALPAGTNNIGDVDVLTVPADPFGANADAAATAGSTGSIQAKLRLMTSQLDAIQTAVQTLDNAIAGSEMQVDVVSSASHAVTNAGTFATQVDGAALTALQLLDNTVFVDDAAFTVASSSVNAIGLLADQASTDSVNEGDIGIPRMTLTRQQISTVAPSADTEGLDIVTDIDLDETETAIKATAGKLYGWYIYNDGAAEVYVKLYNDTVANVVVGTTVATMTIPIPAGSAANVEFTNGIAFSAAITAAATTGVATADATAPAANQVIANFLYK